MSKTPSEKYVHFTVGLLKGSAALEAFQEDAVKHHMIDNPGQLIALRLTEYYEMMKRGIVQPVMRVPAVGVPLEGDLAASQDKTPTTPLPAVAPPQVPFSTVPSTPTAPVIGAGTAKYPAVPPSPRPLPQPVADANPALSQTTPHLRALQQHIQQQQQQKQLQDAVDVIFAPTSADQNADDAADYWTAL